MSREPKSLKSFLDDALKTYKIEDKTRLAQIRAAWEIIGDGSLAGSVRLVRFRKGVLYFRTDSSAWRQEIILRKEKLIDILNKEVPEAKILNLIAVS